MPWTIEVTDTFAGEANYAWVRRYSMPDVKIGEYGTRRHNAAIVRRAKALAGWSGMRCETDRYGDGYTLRPQGSSAPCIVMFINWSDELPDESED